MAESPLQTTESKVSAVDLDEFLGAESETGRTRVRRWLVPAVVVLLLAALLGWWLTGKESATPYATAAVIEGDMQVSVTATGNLAPTNEVSVGSELSGRIDGVFVDVNDHVTQGQPLAQIDTRRLDDAIRSSDASLSAAEAAVTQARTTLEQTRLTLTRQEEVHRLSGGRVPSRVELDSARADHARAEANVHSAQASVRVAAAQLSSDRTNLDRATIRSPVTGVILSRQIEPGQTVASSFNTPTLFVIAEDLASMELEVKVDEADVGQVHEGQAATFNVDAFPGRSFPAKIQRVNVGANAIGNTGAVVSNSTVISYSAILAVENSDLILRPGMTATAEIVTSEERGVLMVPNAALRFRPPRDKQGGFRITMGPPRQTEREVQIGRGSRQTIFTPGVDGSVTSVPVTVGASNGNWTIVSGEGVSAGLEVITGMLAVEE